MMFVAHGLHASRVNLLMNDFAAGLPSPLAFLGLGAAISPALGTPRWGIGVLPVLHEVHASAGRTKPEMAPVSPGKGGATRFGPVETAEDLVGSVRVSLLLDVPGEAGTHEVARALQNRRIAGGVIANEAIEVESVAADGGLFGMMKRGYAMMRTGPPRCGLVATGAVEDLDAIAAELFATQPEFGRERLVPAAVGHRLLEDPATVPERKGTRDPGVPHVFTEPVVGIAELVSVRSRRLTELDGDGVRDLLWRWYAPEGAWVVAHPNYHPGCRAELTKEDSNGRS